VIDALDSYRNDARWDEITEDCAPLVGGGASLEEAPTGFSTGEYEHTYGEWDDIDDSLERVSRNS
jgi:hypothetical protein